MIEITASPIDTGKLLSAVQSDNAGAAVLFVGTTRRMTGDRETVRLKYECYDAMANREISRLVEEAHSQWPIEHCAVVHRTGTVGVGEASVAVCVSCAHRDAAFEAARWLIDTLKVRVPIWKQENWADGTSHWVHPSASVYGAE